MNENEFLKRLEIIEDSRKDIAQAVENLRINIRDLVFDIKEEQEKMLEELHETELKLANDR